MNQNELDRRLIEFSYRGITSGVKMCLELGADPKARYSLSVKYTKQNGHLEVAKTIENYINSQKNTKIY